MTRRLLLMGALAALLAACGRKGPLKPPPDPDAGCASCVVGSCVDACRDGGYGIEGYCGAPGSADPSACCACVAL